MSRQEILDHFQTDMHDWFNLRPAINKYDSADWEVNDHGRRQLQSIADHLGMNEDGKVELMGMNHLKFQTDDDQVITAWRLIK